MFHIPAHKSTTAGQVSGNPFSANRAHYQREQPLYDVNPPIPYNSRSCDAIARLDWRDGCPPTELLDDCISYTLDAPNTIPAGSVLAHHVDKGAWWPRNSHRDN